MDSDGYTRSEDRATQLDRNYAELLQELRVGQAGVQILFAFLLSIAFQQRFSELTAPQRDLYVATLLAAALAAVLLIAPVPIHRILFRRQLKAELVRWADRLAMGGLACLLLAILGAVSLVVDFVAGRLTAGLAAAGVAVVCVSFWYALPTRERLRRRPVDPT